MTEERYRFLLKKEADKFLFIDKKKNAPPAALFRDGFTGETFRMNLASLEIRVKSYGKGGESERALIALRKYEGKGKKEDD